MGKKNRYYEFNGQKSGEGISVVYEKTNDKELALNAQRRYGKGKIQSKDISRD